MSTNANRTVVDQKSFDYLTVVRYSTGAVYITDAESARTLFTITNASELHEKGYLDKLITLLLNGDTARLQSRFSGGIKLDFNAKLFTSVATILDSKLIASAKLAYVISLIKSGIVISPELLEVIFTARPDPIAELENTLSSVKNAANETLIKNVIFPDFLRPPIFPIKSEADYKRYCLTVSFRSSPKAIRYGDFLQNNDTNFFIPAYPSKVSQNSAKSYASINLAVVSDLFPAEYDRFMAYFNKGIVRELRWWARQRFDSGIENNLELSDKGAGRPTTAPLSLMLWGPVFFYLTEAESLGLVEFLDTPNGIKNIYRGVDPKIAGLIAYFWAEGGAEKVTDLAIHMASLQKDRAGYLGVIHSMSLNWINPYAGSQLHARPDLMPYVKALRDPDLKKMPLEWALASY